MSSREAIDLVTAIAWPIVGCLCLVYIWRSDAIGKLIKISDSVKELNGRLAELVEAEQRLTQTSSGILSITDHINQVQDDFLSLKADIESIRDKVEQKPEGGTADVQPAHAQKDMQAMFEDMDEAWQSLLKALIQRFGPIDARSVAVAVRNFAHGNRKGARLTYEEADEIARLHSSIKSYRRRRAYLQDWLDQDTHDAFIDACDHMRAQICR